MARKLSRVVFSSDRQNWATPWGFYRWLSASMGGITLDVCASKKNAKCRRYFTKEQDGLAQSWQGHVWFCNPEFEAFEIWTWKCVREAHLGAPGVALVTAKPDTQWFRQATEIQRAGRLRASYFHQESRVWWLRYAELRVGIYHHDQRLVFDEHEQDDSAPFPSTALIYLPNGWRPPSRFGKDAYMEGRPPLTSGAPP